MHRMHDLLCIVFSSLSVLLREVRLEKTDETALIHIVNFFSRSKFLPNNIYSFPKMRHFVYTHSTFSVLSAMDNGGLENRQPLDFVKYLSELYPGYCTRSDVTYFPQEVRSYKHISKSLPSYEFKNILLVYYFFQKLNDPRFKREFEEAKSKTQNPDQKEMYVCQLDNEFELEKTITPVKDQDEDLIKEIGILVEVLKYKGEYEVSSEDRETLLEYYGKIDLFSVHHAVANFFTVSKIV